MKYIKPNFIKFIIFYLFTVLVFSFTSYRFFIDDFMQLEKNQNQNNINTVLIALNSQIDSMISITIDYSGWDDTYAFMNGKDNNYVHSNFREGLGTLDNLALDFMIFVSLNEKVVFSKYVDEKLKIKKNKFEDELSKKFNVDTALNMLFRFENYYMYLVKTTITQSDGTGAINGYLYSGKIINNKNLSSMTNIFKNIYLSNKDTGKNNLKLKYTFLKNIKIDVIEKNKYLINNIQIYDDKNSYLFSIILENQRDIVNNGKETIIAFNLIISVFLFFILYVLYKNQNILERYNKTLTLKVVEKTQELNITLEALKNKNKELDKLANIDSLTNIKNRRNYFIKSNEALRKAIFKGSEISILEIDLDFFKRINDTYGHLVGDKVLIEFCKIVNSIINKDDIFGRIGGEEFCITFIGKSLDNVSNISEAIRLKCEKTTIVIDDKKINFTISLGLSEREKFTDIDDILRASDDLLYKAKESGRNRLFRKNSR